MSKWLSRLAPKWLQASCCPHLAQLRGGQRLVDAISQQGAAHRRQLRPDLVRAARQQLNHALVCGGTGLQPQLPRARL